MSWLLRALDAFVAHYHRELNHQGLGNELIIRETRPLWATQVCSCPAVIRASAYEKDQVGDHVIVHITKPAGRYEATLVHVSTKY